jgi:predicted metalloprotease with PDZ domain
MTKKQSMLLIAVLTVFSPIALAQHYAIRLTENDTFLVTYNVQKELSSGAVFQFAKSIPGVYDNVNYGSLVIGLRAFDNQGELLSVDQQSDNQWRIHESQRLSHVEYEIDDSYGSTNQETPPYIAGTAIEADHMLINTIGVLGYFDELRPEPTTLSLDLQPDWQVGSALEQSDGLFYAADFDRLAESPILAGELDSASITVNGVSVEVYIYSSTKRISASQVLTTISPAVQATANFLGTNPVDHYVFLMQFLDADSKTRNNIRGIGALEHSNSSTYVLSEDPRILDFLNEWVAHEYFHIVTPLNLHSSEVRPFRYDRNNPDSHLWLYEGVTVWASEILLLRDGQMSEQEYFDLLTEKILAHEEEGNAGQSLVELSRSIYSNASMDNFSYIDNKASLAVFCLDVLMLSESGGTYGVRDLLVQLMRKFGPNEAFSDSELFDQIGLIAGANAANFIDEHIVHASPINSALYLDLIGYEFNEESRVISSIPRPTVKQKSLRQSWLRN